MASTVHESLDIGAHDSTFRLVPSPQDDTILCKRALTYFPPLYWLPKYNIKAHLLNDITAGVTAGIMLIPQGMGYALIAGLPPIYGLYGSMFGPLLYSLFGTSGQLNVAPVALISLMTGEALESQLSDLEFPNEDAANHSKVAIASAMAFQVGIIQIVIGLLRGGLIASLLSHSVILGFTMAASILIGFSQMKHIFRIKIPRGEFVEMIAHLIETIEDYHWQSLVMSLLAIALLSVLRYWKKSKRPLWGKKYAMFVPGPLIVVIASTLYVYATDNQSEFNIIGKIDNGLPEFVWFFSELPSLNVFWSTWSASLMIALIAFIQSYAVANKFAEKRNYQIEASQELIALGVPNLFGSFFQIYPITGGLSRTAVVDAANGITPLNSLICGVFMIMVLTVLLTYFQYLPLCVLASIILVSVSGLFDYVGLKDLWRVKRKDVWVAMTTFVVTLFIGVEVGVAVGVGTSMLMFLQRAANPHYAVLGKIRGHDDGRDVVYRNIKNYENAVVREDMLLIRWDSSLFFGNIQTFKDKVSKQMYHKMEGNKEKDVDRWCLVLCFTAINDIDATAAHALHLFLEEITKKWDDLVVILTNIKKPVKVVLEKVDILTLVGEHKIFFEIHDAEIWWDQYLKKVEENEESWSPRMDDEKEERNQEHTQLLL